MGERQFIIHLHTRYDHRATVYTSDRVCLFGLWGKGRTTLQRETEVRTNLCGLGLLPPLEIRILLLETSHVLVVFLLKFLRHFLVRLEVTTGKTEQVPISFYYIGNALLKLRL
jgi:hypothetical protein